MRKRATMSLWRVASAMVVRSTEDARRVVTKDGTCLQGSLDWRRGDEETRFDSRETERTRTWRFVKDACSYFKRFFEVLR